MTRGLSSTPSIRRDNNKRCLLLLEIIASNNGDAHYLSLSHFLRSHFIIISPSSLSIYIFSFSLFFPSFFPLFLPSSIFSFPYSIFSLSSFIFPSLLLTPFLHPSPSPPPPSSLPPFLNPHFFPSSNFLSHSSYPSLPPFLSLIISLLLLRPFPLPLRPSPPSGTHTWYTSRPSRFNDGETCLHYTIACTIYV